MKKTAAFLLTALLCLGLGACDKAATDGGSGGAQSDDPKAMYQQATEKMAALEYMDATTEMKINMTAGGTAEEMSVKMDTKRQNVDGALKFSATMSMSAGEDSLVMDTYYADDYYYIQMGELKLKQKADASMAQAMSGMMLELDANALSDFALDEQTNTISFTGDPDQLSGLADSAMSQLQTTTGQLPEGTDIQISDVKGSITLDDNGYIASQALEMKCTFTVNGEASDMDYVINVTNNNPGETGEVALPDDLASYVEIPADSGAADTSAADANQAA